MQDEDSNGTTRFKRKLVPLPLLGRYRLFGWYHLNLEMCLQCHPQLGLSQCCTSSASVLPWKISDITCCFVGVLWELIAVSHTNKAKGKDAKVLEPFRILHCLCPGFGLWSSLSVGLALPGWSIFCFKESAAVLRQSIRSTVPFRIWGFAFFIIDNNSLEKFELLPKRVRDGTGLLIEANDWIVLQLCHVYK